MLVDLTIRIPFCISRIPLLAPLTLLIFGKPQLHSLYLLSSSGFNLGSSLSTRKILVRPSHIVLKQPGQSPVSVCLGEEWIDLDGRLVVGDAHLQISPVLPGVAPIAVGFCQARVDCDSPVVVCNSSFQISSSTLHQTTVIVDKSIMRIEPNRLI